MGEFSCRHRIVEVQDHREKHAHRLGPVDDIGDHGVIEDAGGLRKVHLGDIDTGGLGQQRPRMRDHDRIVVYVADARAGDDVTRGHVNGRVRGQPGPEVEKLPDALPSGPGDGPANELPVVTAGPHPIGSEFGDLGGKFTVSGEVVLPAEKEVVDARDVRNARIETTGAVISGHAGHHTEWVSGVGVLSWSRKPPDWCCHSLA